MHSMIVSPGVKMYVKFLEQDIGALISSNS